MNRNQYKCSVCGRFISQKEIDESEVVFTPCYGGYLPNEDGYLTHGKCMLLRKLKVALKKPIELHIQKYENTAK